jgi:hypothetical protein
MRAFSAAGPHGIVQLRPGGRHRRAGALSLNNKLEAASADNMLSFVLWLEA